MNSLNALKFAKMSQAIYQNDKNGQAHISVIKPLMEAADPDIQSVELFVVENVVSAYVELPDFDVFVWRGTDDRRDWFDDFNAGWREKYHHGMWHHTLKTFAKMRTARGNKDKPLIFTGHSLGAACATIAAHIWYEDTGSTNFKVFTFGSPRCLRAGTKFPGGVEIYRFKHSNDIVPRVPPFFFGFKHVGRRVYIDHNNNIHVGAHFWSVIKDHFAEYTRAKTWDLNEFFTDHLIKNYIEPLEGAKYV